MARAEAARRGDKEELDVAALDRLRTLKRRPETIDELESLYYLRRPDLKTMRELATLLDVLTKWSE